MTEAFTNSRLLRAFRLALYPAFEPAAQKRLQRVIEQAENARRAGDLAGAEQVYVRAIAEAESRSDPAYVLTLRSWLGQIYQEQHRYREAEVIFRDQLAAALESSEPNTQVHAAHMRLARLYDEEGNHAGAEEHYKAALAQTENPDVWPDRELTGSTALWLGKFYVKQHRYSDAEPLFERVVEICAARASSDSSLAHYLLDLAKIYEAQEKYESAEESYRRALTICEERESPSGFSIVRVLDELARFCKARGRFAEAEDLARRSLSLVEEKLSDQNVADEKLRRSNPELYEATIKRARVPISVALDQLAEIYERQDKFAEAEPLRKRSFEIQQEAYGDANSWLWVDSLAAYASTLRKIGREQEAAKLDERVEAIRAKFPPGSVRTSTRLVAMPMKTTLRRRFHTFMYALRHPSPR